MSDSEKDAAEVSAIREANMVKALTEPLHEGIRTDMGQSCLMRDIRRGRVLVDGFGPFGVGRMWIKTKESLEEYPNRLPGFLSCPILTKEMEIDGIRRKIALKEAEIAKLKESIEGIPE